ncbi:cyclase family protein [Actinomycetota bacterium]|nr:cyclase family protein [Actinomycetota bacterium]
MSVGTTERLIEAFSNGYGLIDMSQPMHAGMPTSPNHPGFRLGYLRRHGDMVRPDGGSAANELIVTGGHVGTHVDALAHVSHEGLLHGGIPVEEAFYNGRFHRHGIDEMKPVITRGLFLDIPRARGVDVLAAGEPIETADFQAACELIGAEPEPGDAVIIRSGWGRHFEGDHNAYLGQVHGVPGPTASAAQWLADRQIVVTGADSTAYEHIPAGKGHSVLPAHKVLLVDAGINIIEHMNLEEAGKRNLGAFLFFLAPLKILGGTGSPARPLAIIGSGENAL